MMCFHGEIRKIFSWYPLLSEAVQSVCFMLQIAGGGGAGGRVAIYVTTSNTYVGEYHTNGGEGYVEDGGSGTTFIEAPDNDGEMKRSLYIDNKGGKPLSQFITDKTKDSSRTYIITSDKDTAEDMIFDHVYIYGVGHLAVMNTTDTNVEIRIKNISGDNTGMLHTSVDQRLVVENGESPFPVAFRVYDKATIQLPEGKRL